MNQILAVDTAPNLSALGRV